jgi:hypothetical protein
MADLLGDPAGLIPSDQLYRCLDKLLARLPQLDLDFTQFTAFSARKCLIEHNRDT